MIRMTVFLALATVAQPAAAWTQDPEARPEILTKLIECSKIADVPARVACYDRNVAALDQAERKRDVVFVDRTELRKARRSLFGFTMPKLKIFDDRGTEPEFTRIEARIKAARQVSDRWQFDLDDGTRWAQSDPEGLARTPKPGAQIRIRKAAMGSFFANVETAPAIRVRRVD